jgi:hypothetical protein
MLRVGEIGGVVLWSEWNYGLDCNENYAPLTKPTRKKKTKFGKMRPGGLKGLDKKNGYS